MSDATVRLDRRWSGIGIGAQSEQWNIAIDGTVVGSIANTETVDVSVEPGHHTLRLAPAGTTAPSGRSTSGRTRSSAFGAAVRESGRCWWRRSSTPTYGFRSGGSDLARRCLAGTSSSGKIELSSSRSSPAPRACRLGRLGWFPTPASCPCTSKRFNDQGERDGALSAPPFSQGR
jgi:hypothetical protein